MSSKLRADQKSLVKNFVQWTQSSEKGAILCLTKCNWNLELAVDYYYQNNIAAQDMVASNTDNSTMRKFFDRYANDREDMKMRSKDEKADDKIGPNGISHLLSDLQLSSTDRRVLIIVCKAKAQVQCELTWNEFRECLTTLRADSVDSLRQRLEEMDRNLRERADFKELYNYTFNYGKNAGQRNLDLETSIVYWKILFKDQFALLPMWEEYLQTEYKKPVTKDTWNLLFDFAMTIRPDLTNYDDEGAWPVVLDQFVSWARPRIAPPRNEQMEM